MEYLKTTMEYFLHHERIQLLLERMEQNPGYKLSDDIWNNQVKTLEIYNSYIEIPKIMKENIAIYEIPHKTADSADRRFLGTESIVIKDYTIQKLLDFVNENENKTYIIFIYITDLNASSHDMFCTDKSTKIYHTKEENSKETIEDIKHFCVENLENLNNVKINYDNFNVFICETEQCCNRECIHMEIKIFLSE